jgi:ATP-dependent DNA helicase RecQ
MGRLLKICQKQKGIGIVYVRNRKKTKEISEFLKKNNVAADFYHAGLTTIERDLKQNAWMKERTRVIVSTNAFGMGIDKPNVRFVVHMDLPDSPEAYFQEAGRAGRDEKKAFAVLLYNNSDIIDLKKTHEQAFPSVEYIKMVYNCLGNYFQLAQGSGKDQSMEFDLLSFSGNYDLDPILVFNAMKFLEKDGYLALSEAMTNPSRILFTLGKEDLYRFQVANPKYDAFVKLLLRSYPGLFTEFVKIREQDIAKRANINVEQTERILNELHKMNILEYEKQNKRPLITWVEERVSSDSLRVSKENHAERKQFSRKRLDAMAGYVQSSHTCRSIFLLAYFGERKTMKCGQCDVCLNIQELKVTDFEFDQLHQMIKKTLVDQRCRLEVLIEILPTNISEKKILKVIRWLTDHGSIIEEPDGKLRWKV